MPVHSAFTADPDAAADRLRTASLDVWERVDGMSVTQDFEV